MSIDFFILFGLGILMLINLQKLLFFNLGIGICSREFHGLLVDVVLRNHGNDRVRQ